MSEEIFNDVFRRIALHVNDTLWMQHLQVMDYTRSSVTLRAYGQREPLVEYKKEGLRLFNEMQNNFDSRVAEMMAKVDIKAVSADTQQKEENIPAVLQTDTIEIMKDGEVRQVKEKKLQTYLDTGWKRRTP